MLLLRNLLVARLISVEDYGIAATFAICMAIVEMLSNLGTQQLIVQDDNGNDPEMQAGLQGFQAFRGLLSGLVLFAIATPIARFLHVEHIAWAYKILALVPVLNGLMHFDIYRLNRQLRYLPFILSNSVPAFISVLLIWPLFEVFGDYRVMLYAVIIQNIGMVVTSHLVAERPYRMKFERAMVGHILKFGWPLMINSLLLFAVFNGDRLIVGRELGLESLAIFSMGVTLTLTPTLVIARSTQSFFLPQLSAAKSEPEKFAHLSMATMQTSIVNGLLMILGILCFGAPFISFVLGEKYTALIALITWLSILQATRVFRTGCSVVALSLGKTANAMVANGFRALALLPAWYVAATGGSLVWIIWIAITGEAVGYLASLIMVRWRLRVNLRPMLMPISAALLFLTVITIQLVLDEDDWLGIHGIASSVLLLVIVVVTTKNLRHYIRGKAFSGYSE